MKIWGWKQGTAQKCVPFFLKDWFRPIFTIISPDCMHLILKQSVLKGNISSQSTHCEQMLNCPDFINVTFPHNRSEKWMSMSSRGKAKNVIKANELFPIIVYPISNKEWPPIIDLAAVQKMFHETYSLVNILYSFKGRQQWLMAKNT